MTGKADGKAEKLMNAYYDYIGDQHLENICRDIEAREEEINRTMVPESLDEWFWKYVAKHKKKQAAHLFLRKLRTVGTKAAAILFVVAASMLVITLSVDAIRVKMFNMLLKTNKEYTSVRVDEVPTVSIEWEEYYYPAWLPEGFCIDAAYEFRNMKMIKFRNGDNQQIMFTQAANGAALHLNTEDGEQTEVMINHKAAILSEKSGENILFWNNDESSFCLSSDLNSDILIQIAESVKKK